MIMKSQRITNKEAKLLMENVISIAEKHKVAVAVAIVDKKGNLVLLERMDEVMGIASLIAEGKATTAILVNFLENDRCFQSLSKGNSLSNLFISCKKPYVPAEGGFPLFRNECLIGGIAVSGSMNMELDKQITEEALKKLYA